MVNIYEIEESSDLKKLIFNDNSPYDLIENNSCDLIFSKNLMETLEKESKIYKNFYKLKKKQPEKIEKIFLKEIINQNYIETKKYIGNIEIMLKKYLDEYDKVDELNFTLNFIQKKIKNKEDKYEDVFEKKLDYLEYLSNEKKYKYIKKYLKNYKIDKIKKEKIEKLYISKELQNILKKEENSYIKINYKNFIILLLAHFFSKSRTIREKILFENKLKKFEEIIENKEIIKLNGKEGIIISIKEKSNNFNESIKIQLYDLDKKNYLI